MVLKDKKLAVFHYLLQETKPVGLPNIVENLEYAERTVRRWLSEMAEEGLVEKTGRKRATKYRAIRSLAFNECFQPESETVLAQVRRSIGLRIPVSYSDSWLEQYQPNKTFYISPELRRQLHAQGKRTHQAAPAGTYAHQIYNRLLIDLSYNSSRLEGNTYSLLDTQKLLLEGKEAAGKLNEEKIMILNHKDAIRYLVDHASNLEITTHAIYTLHYLLSDGLIETQYSGKVRDHGVKIGGSTYLPFEHSKQLQPRLERIIKKASEIEDPFEQSFFLLIHISYLQAFADVNKRTARLAANIPLIKGNFVPLSFNDLAKDDYTSAMIAVYELQDIRPILDLYMFSYLRTCAMYDSTIKAMGLDELRVRYRAQRRALVREIVLKKLKGEMLQKFVHVKVDAIPKKDRTAFIEDVHDDLEHLDQHHIGGLGITPEQLEAWAKEALM